VRCHRPDTRVSAVLPVTRGLAAAHTDPWLRRAMPKGLMSAWTPLELKKSSSDQVQTCGGSRLGLSALADTEDKLITFGRKGMPKSL